MSKNHNNGGNNNRQNNHGGNNGGNHNNGGGNNNGNKNKRKGQYDTFNLQRVNPDNYPMPDNLGYNLFGLKPVASDYNLVYREMSSTIQRILGHVITDIVDVTVEPRPESKTVSIWVWFRGDGEHFVRHANSDSLLAGGQIGKRSKEFNDFVQTFGYLESDDNPQKSSKINNNLILSSNTNPHISAKMQGVRVSILALASLAFDAGGEAFNAVYGGPVVRTSINCEYLWKYDNHGNPVSFIGVGFKKRNKVLGSHSPQPRQNGNFN